MIHHVNRRVASHYGTAQIELLDHADSLADHVDAVIVRAWKDLWRVLKDCHPGEAQHRAEVHFRKLADELIATLADQFFHLGHWAYNQAAGTLAKTIPIPYLQFAAVSRTGGFREDGPGFTQLSFGPDRQLQATNRLADLLQPSAGTEEEQREMFRSLLFPPPASDVVSKIVLGPSGPTNWVDRMQAETKLAAPQDVAAVIMAGTAAGLTNQQMARQLLPIVQGVQSTARRVARNEGMRIAHMLQIKAQEPLQHLTIGWQVHATKDQNTRSKHRQRDGTIYYMEPKAGQKGMNECPFPPPMEADGTIAHNCRCRIAPVMGPHGAYGRLMANPEKWAQFQALAEKNTVPETQVYSEWWAKASEKLKRKSVGTRRYSQVKDILGEHPQWEHFVDLEGNLIPVDALAKETPEERRRRLALLQQDEKLRADQLKDISRYGFLPPSAPGTPGDRSKLPPQLPPAQSVEQATDRILAHHPVAEITTNPPPHADPKKFGVPFKNETQAIQQATKVYDELTRLRQEFPRMNPAAIARLLLTNHVSGRSMAVSKTGRKILAVKGRDYTEAERDKLAEREQQHGGWWTVERPGTVIQDNFRHELAHNLTDARLEAAWEGLYHRYGQEWFKRHVSNYAGESPREGLAETFALFTMPGYLPGILPPDVEAFMRTLLGG